MASEAQSQTPFDHLNQLTDLVLTLNLAK